MSAEPRFPQEIIELVLDELEAVSQTEHSLDTLLACSLVSSSLRDIAQARLFQSFIIPYPEPTDLRGRNRNCISALTPRLCGFIKRLTFAFDTLAVASGFHIDPHRYRFDVDVLPTMHFPKLVYFNIRTSNSTGHRLTWRLIPLHLRKLIYSMMQWPTIRTLEIDGIIDFPAPAVSHCRQLRSFIANSTQFTARDVTCPAISTTSASPTCNQGYLESFSYRQYMPLRRLIEALCDPTSSLSLNRIKKLQVEVYFREPSSTHADCESLLDLTLSYLEELALRFELWSSMRIPFAHLY
ncbi:hypothetical protein DXG01_007074 [Tephrocybe rancida]|nr:hypothetical protein DXG01_007074 [Tephrocybe rancida]